MKPLLVGEATTVTPQLPCRETDRARFARQTVTSSSGCLLWIGVINKHGYGLFSLGGKHYTAHRVAWQWAHGPITSEVCVLHRCDTPACVLVEHLSIGSHAANIADKVAKNRQAQHERNGTAKLTVDQAREIRILAGRLSHSMIAARFGVSKRAVQFVLQGKTWR